VNDVGASFTQIGFGLGFVAGIVFTVMVFATNNLVQNWLARRGRRAVYPKRDADAQ
jgi:hypothetical protein